MQHLNAVKSIPAEHRTVLYVVFIAIYVFLVTAQKCTYIHTHPYITLSHIYIDMYVKQPFATFPQIHTTHERFRAYLHAPTDGKYADN